MSNLDPNRHGASPPAADGGSLPSSGGGDIYRLLVENSYDLVGELDAEGRYLYANPSHLNSVGLTPVALVGTSVFDFVHPQDRDKARREMQRPGGTALLRLQHADGHWNWFECSFRHFDTLHGPRIVVISRDISARREGEIKFEVLASLGTRLSGATSKLEAARIVADAADKLCGWDAFSLDLWEPEAGLIEPVLEIDECAGVRTEMPGRGGRQRPSPMAEIVLRGGPRRILRKGNDFEQGTRPFGDVSRASASLLFVPVIEAGKAVGLVSIQSYRINAYSRSDLKLLEVLAGHCAATFARLRAIEALAASQARFEAFMEHSPSAAWIKDEAGRYIYANTAAGDFLGASPEAISGKTDLEMLPRTAAEEHLREDEHVRENRHPVRIQRAGHSGPDRQWFVCKFPFADPAGGMCVGAVALEVSERVLMERSLRASEDRFRTLFESAPVGIALVQQSRLTYANRAYRRMFGLHQDNGLDGRTLLEDLAPASRRDLEHLLDASGAGQEARLVLEVRGLRNGEREFPCLLELARVEVAGQGGWLAFASDISEQRVLEKQLAQAQKMESLGRLAGGVAHDFANLLTIIQSHVGRLERGVSNVRTAVEGIARASAQASELTRQLLALSRRQSLNFSEVDMNEAVRRTAGMMERVLGHRIALHLDLAHTSTAILADRDSIEELILNLAMTARDGMKPGGHLTISTRCTPAGEHPGNGSSHGTVSLTVLDTGRGIPPADLERIFEPFFQTSAGPEVPLRLATVHGIVNQHNAKIEVASEPGVGTRFTVHFSAVRAPQPPLVPARGSKCVLVAEDCPDVRGLVQRDLADAGYDVLVAASFEDGVRVFEQHRERIDLVLADVFLGDGSGRDLAARSRAAKPGLRTIIMTGYDPSQSRREQVASEGFLAKPFTGRQLLEVVDRMFADSTVK